VANIMAKAIANIINIAFVIFIGFGLVAL